MFVGHYAASFVAKRLDERLPLWLLFLAVQFLDVLWGAFVLLGIEKLRIIPHFTQANALDLYFMPFTHGLLTALLWSGLVYGAIRQFRLLPGEDLHKPALLVAAAVFSHFLLDAVVHVPDLPLLGNSFKIGLGVWNHLGGTLLLESALVLGAVGVYLRGATLLSSRQKIATVVFGLVITGINIGNYLGPAPTSNDVFAVTALAAYGILAAATIPLDRQKAASRGEVHAG